MITDKLIRTARFQNERAVTAANFKRAMTLKGTPLEERPPFTEVLFDMRGGKPQLFIIHSGPRVLIPAWLYESLVATGSLDRAYPNRNSPVIKEIINEPRRR